MTLMRIDLPPSARCALPGRVVLVAAIVLASATLDAEARNLKLEHLSAQRVERLPKEAREHYEMALAGLDRILYDDAMKEMNLAIEKDPDNAHLRLMGVQLAVYLGDTRRSSGSIKYYDLAITHLKQMTASPRLNLREKQKAQKTLEKVSALQRSVIERDELRRKWGLDVAKQYMREINAGANEEKEKAEENLKKRKQLIDLLSQVEASQTKSGSETEPTTGIAE